MIYCIAKSIEIQRDEKNNKCPVTKTTQFL